MKLDGPVWLAALEACEIFERNCPLGGAFVFFKSVNDFISQEAYLDKIPENINIFVNIPHRQVSHISLRSDLTKCFLRLFVKVNSTADQFNPKLLWIDGLRFYLDTHHHSSCGSSRPDKHTWRCRLSCYTPFLWSHSYEDPLHTHLHLNTEKLNITNAWILLKQ